VNIPIVNARWKFNSESNKREVVKEDNDQFIAQVRCGGGEVDWREVWREVRRTTISSLHRCVLGDCVGAG